MNTGLKKRRFRHSGWEDSIASKPTVCALHVPLEKVPRVVDSHSFVVASPRSITLVTVGMLVAVCVLMLFKHVVDVVVLMLVHVFVFMCVIRHMSVVLLV